jgi:hypothetical protein
MSEPVSLIMRQFLAWVAERPRRREDVREAWRSCPRISVWEDAVMDELVAYGADGLIGLTARGREVLISSPDGAKRNPGEQMCAPPQAREVVMAVMPPRIALRSMRATNAAPARRRAR